MDRELFDEQRHPGTCLQQPPHPRIVPLQVEVAASSDELAYEQVHRRTVEGCVRPGQRERVDAECGGDFGGDGRGRRHENAGAGRHGVEFVDELRDLQRAGLVHSVEHQHPFALIERPLERHQLGVTGRRVGGKDRDGVGDDLGDPGGSDGHPHAGQGGDAVRDQVRADLGQHLPATEAGRQHLLRLLERGYE